MDKKPEKYVVLKNQYLNNPSINHISKKIFTRLDNMDVVDALHILMDIESLLRWKIREANGE